MDKLTDKYVDEFGITHYIINDDVQPIYYRSHWFDPKEQAFKKLTQFEDFMKEQGFESLEELKEFMQDTRNAMLDTLKVANRWQKLKDLLILFYTVGKTSGANGFEVYNAILDKMQELEQGEADAKD